MRGATPTKLLLDVPAERVRVAVEPSRRQYRRTALTGWPEFTPDGKVVKVEDTSTIAEADGDWEWCKGRGPGRGNEMVCALTAHGAPSQYGRTVALCDHLCQWDDRAAVIAELEELSAP